MARDTRTVRSAIRIDTQTNVNEGKTFPDGAPLPVVMQSSSVTYGPGQEDELEQALSAQDGKRLLETGALEGDWKFGAKADASAAGGQNANDLDTEIEEKLLANFDSPDAVKAASDDEILAIEGIGPATLKKIREVYPAKA